MTAVLLALASAVCFGGMAVALRVALREHPEPDVAAMATTVVALLVALGAAILEPGSGELAHPEELAVFALAGLIAPGVS